jgi:membrane associated rhomboid family serine protease
MSQNNFISDLKLRYATGGMFTKLIAVNLIVFLIISILTVFFKLSGVDVQIGSEFSNLMTSIFALQTDPMQLLTHPWGIFTYMFSHFDTLHCLFNLLILYFAGKTLENYFSGTRILVIYLLGGITGAFFEVIAHSIFPVFIQHANVTGASGANMALFMALAFHKRDLEINLFGVLPIKILYLALIYFAIDFIGLGSNDGVAHFAHIGGALFGIYAITNPYANKNISFMLERYFDKIKSKFKLRNKTKMKVSHNYTRNTATGTKKAKSDEFYAMDKRDRQVKTDAILDKISKSGYDSLSKEEKDFLFNQSNNA